VEGSQRAYTGQARYLGVRGDEPTDAVSEGELVEVAMKHDAFVLFSVALGQLVVHVRLPKLVSPAS
jgi:hypothetical protein